MDIVKGIGINKKKMVLGLLVSMLSCPGNVSAEEIDVSNLIVPSEISVQACEAYMKKCNEIIEQYGLCSMVEYSEDHDGWTEMDAMFMMGLSAAQLLDFDGDGNDDLLVVYQEGALTGNCSYDPDDAKPIPQSSNYHLEIWSYTDQGLVELLDLGNVGFYNSFQSEYWDSDCCFINVLRDKSGRTVVQLMQDWEEASVETDEMATQNMAMITEALSNGNVVFTGNASISTGGYGYENIYFENGSSVLDYYTFDSGKYSKNNEEISHEQWEHDITDYSEIVFTTILSEDDLNSYEQTELDYSYDASRYGVQLTETLTKTILKSLEEGKPEKCRGNDMLVIPAYLKELDFRIRFNHTPITDNDDCINVQTNLDYVEESVINAEEENNLFTYHNHRFAYSLYDINEDGIPEMIVKNNSTEVESYAFVCGFDGSEIKSYGEFFLDHTGMAVNDNAGILLDYMHMGLEKFDLLTVSNDEVSISELGYTDTSQENYLEVVEDYLEGYTHYLPIYTTSTPLLLYLYNGI